MNNKYFAHSNDEGVVRFNTKEEAEDYANDLIQDHLQDGWSEEVVYVFVGEITMQATKTDIQTPLEYYQNEEEANESEFDEYCNYELMPLPKLPTSTDESVNKCPWIRVEDKFSYPGSGDSVLLLINSGYITTGWIQFNNKEGKYEFSQNDTRNRIYGITHWMPLPKLPTSTDEIVKDVAKNYTDNILVNCKMEGSSGIKEEVSSWGENDDMHPGQGVKVLIKTNDGNIEVASYQSYSKVWVYGNKREEDYYHDNVVTHWMYIPI